MLWSGSRTGGTYFSSGDVPQAPCYLGHLNVWATWGHLLLCTTYFEIHGDRPSFVSLKNLVVGTRKALLSCYLNRSIADIDFQLDAVRVRSHSFRSIAQYVEKPASLQELHSLGDTSRVAITNGVPTQIKNVLADCVIQAQEFRFIHSRFHSF